MFAAERFSYLIEQIYDASLSPARWPRVLAEIQTSIHGCGCLLGINTGGRPAAIQHCGYDETAIKLFAEHYADKSHVWSCFTAASEGSMVHDRQVLLPEKRKKDIFANEWARKYDTTDCVILPVWKRQRLTAFTVFARSPSVGDFDKESLETVRRLWPHFRQAAAIQTRLGQIEGRADLTLSALDMMPAGVILVSTEGSIEFTNKAADRLLSARRLRCEGRYIVGRTSDETQALRSLITEAAALGKAQVRSAGIMRLEGSETVAPLVVRSVPLSNASACEPAAFAPVMLLLNEMGGDAKPAADALRAAFGLTATEARIARLLAGGASVQQIAEKLGTVRSTVTSHLSAIFAKTRTNRQADLVRTLWAIPQILADHDDHRKPDA